MKFEMSLLIQLCIEKKWNPYDWNTGKLEIIEVQTRTSENILNWKIFDKDFLIFYCEFGGRVLFQTLKSRFVSIFAEFKLIIIMESPWLWYLLWPQRKKWGVHIKKMIVHFWLHSTLVVTSLSMSLLLWWLLRWSANLQISPCKSLSLFVWLDALYKGI